MKFLNALTGGYLIPILIASAVAAWGGSLWWSYSKGYAKSDSEWSVKWVNREAQLQDEKLQEWLRQTEVNRVAQEESRKQIDQMEAENAAMEETIKELQDEAAKDPLAKRPALSNDGRLRINRVR